MATGSLIKSASQAQRELLDAGVLVGLSKDAYNSDSQCVSGHRFIRGASLACGGSGVLSSFHAGGVGGKGG